MNKFLLIPIILLTGCSTFLTQVEDVGYKAIEQRVNFSKAQLSLLINSACRSASIESIGEVFDTPDKKEAYNQMCPDNKIEIK